MFATAGFKKINNLRADTFDKCTVSLSNDGPKTSLQCTLQQAATDIVCGDFFEARQLLKRIMADNVENPAIYNLFGISFEREGDRLKASRFYRVSYYMDQTYRAAADNLERVCAFNYKQDIDSIAWGIDMREVK